jgi:hypothetical protein
MSFLWTTPETINFAEILRGHFNLKTKYLAKAYFRLIKKIVALFIHQP